MIVEEKSLNGGTQVLHRFDNGYGDYEVEKAKYANCKAYIRLTPADDNPLWRMKKHLEETGSTVQIDWN